MDISLIYFNPCRWGCTSISEDLIILILHDNQPYLEPHHLITGDTGPTAVHDKRPYPLRRHVITVPPCKGTAHAYSPAKPESLKYLFQNTVVVTNRGACQTNGDRQYFENLHYVIARVYLNLSMIFSLTTKMRHLIDTWSSWRFQCPLSNFP